jgi:Uma2 family endonuclease
MAAHRRPFATLTHPIRRADIVRMAVPLLKGPFTVDAFQRLAELGVLREDDRVELIAGQVVEMTPIGDRHASCVRRLIRVFGQRLLEVALIDIQNPVVLGAQDAPQPDLTLLRPRADAYPKHPRAADILLVIEVADTSLTYDRDIKIRLYARAGVPEAWLVDLSADLIQVYREPPSGEHASVRFVSRGDGITPLHFPNVTFSSDEILG